MARWMRSRSGGRSSALIVALAFSVAGCGGATPSSSPPGSATASGVPASLSPTTAPSTAPSASSPADSPAPASPEPSAVTDLVTVTDDSGAISISVPASWSEVSVRWYAGTEERGPGLVASSDPEAFAASFDGQAGATRWDVEGVFVGLSTSLAEELELGTSIVTVLTNLARWHGGDEETERGWDGSCLRGGASSYDSANDEHTGFVTDWHDCGGIGTLVLDLGASSTSGGYVAQAIVVLPEGDGASDRGWEILESMELDLEAVAP